MADDMLTTLTADLVAAMVAHNTVAASELPELIKSIHRALADLGKTEAEPEADKPQGAVSVRKSLADPNKLLSMIDGKPYSMLKRHIARHGYTPDTYREAFGLKRDYPMVAPAYSERRSGLTRTIGLERKTKVAAEPQPSTPAKRRHKSGGIEDALAQSRAHLGTGEFEQG